MFKPCFVVLLSLGLTWTGQRTWAANVFWAGVDPAGPTNWFSSINWSNRSTYPYPGPGDSIRIGDRAQELPYLQDWPHYNGTNSIGPTDGVFRMANVTNTWFFMEGGHLLHNSWVNIGQAWPHTGRWIHNGGIFDSSPWIRQFTVAAGGNGELTISGGAIQVDNFAIIRNNPGVNPAPTNAWALITGNGRISCSIAYVGIYGTAATLTNRDNGMFIVTNALTLGRNEGGIGFVYQEGGTVIAGYLDLYTAGSEYVLSGGTLLAGYIDSTYGAFGGSFVFDGGILKARGTSERLIRRISGVTINAGKTAYIDTAGFFERAQAAMSGDGGLTKLGQGILRLEGTNTYTGPTVVQEGMLTFRVNQNLGTVTVNPNAAIGTDIDAADNQVVLSTLSLASNTALGFNLYAADVTPSPARMAVSSVILNGPVTLAITNAQLLSPGVYALLDYDTLSGSGSLTLAPLPCGMVANLVTNGTQLELHVVQGAAAPQIATPPASQTVLENRSATFSVTLTQCPELAAYQWLFNGNPIAGATNADYTIARAQLTDAGNYQVVVSNAVGSVTSTPPAVLTVIPDANPPVPLSATRPYSQKTNVVVVFDEWLDAASAQNAGFYVLSNATAGAVVGSASAALLLPDQKTVLLTFASDLADNTLYRLTVGGVKDLALNAQPGASLVVGLLGVLTPTGPNRLIVIEAEEADEIVPSSLFDFNLRSWEVVTDRPGYSGWAALQCLPNYGQVGAPTGPEGPVARFVVDFPAGDTYPITYYLWVRGAGATPEDDSCHATLDWEYPYAVKAPSLTQNFYQPGGGWGWCNRSSQGGFGVAMFVVSNAGPHTVDILMREDGFYCDKLVLSTDPNYNPSTLNGGLGPDTVTRSVFPPPLAFVPGTLRFVGGQFKMDLQTFPGAQNVVEYKDHLGAPTWSVLTSFPGDGSVQTITDSSPPAAGRLYRARTATP